MDAGDRGREISETEAPPGWFAWGAKAPPIPRHSSEPLAVFINRRGVMKFRNANAFRCDEDGAVFIAPNTGHCL